MTVFTFDAKVSYSPSTSAFVPGVVGAVYLESDTGFVTPLTVTVHGLPPATTVTSQANGLVPLFTVDQAANGLSGTAGARVVWKSGSHQVTLTSLPWVIEQAAGDVLPSRVTSITGLGATAATNTALIQDAVDAATAGDVIVLPAGTWPIDDGILIEKRLHITGAATGTQLTQTVWGQPALDILETGAGSLVENLALVCEETKEAIASTVRDGAAVNYAAAVWACADRLTVRNCTLTGFTSGVRVTNWDDATQTSTGFTVDVLVEDILTSGCDWGVVAAGVERFTARGVRGSYTLRAGSGDPAHLIYISDAQPNRDVTIEGCKAFDGDGGHAFQVKNISGLALRDATARSCPGLVSIRNVTDADVTTLTSISDLGDSNGSVYVQGGGTEARIKMRGLSINGLVDNRAVRLDGTDCTLEDSTITTVHATQSDSYDVHVIGTRNTVANVKTVNTGAASWRSVGLAGGSGHTVREPVALDTRAVVTIAAGVTGCVVEYDPTRSTRNASAGSRMVSVAAAMSTVVRRRSTTASFTAPGSAIQVRADEADHVKVSVTGTGAFSVTLPIEPITNASLLFEFKNSAGGATGTISWNAVYVFTAGAFTGPGAGLTNFISFRYDGTSWIETWRS